MEPLLECEEDKLAWNLILETLFEPLDRTRGVSDRGPSVGTYPQACTTQMRLVRRNAGIEA